MTPRKRKRKVRKTRARYKDRSNIINSIFKPGEKDLSYITKDPELLKQHIKFINESSYVYAGKIASIKVPGGRSEGLSPRNFDFFWKYYQYIFERWFHLIKCCFYTDYPYYKFFGGKGIYMSKEFLDGKKFCIWCLKNGLTSKVGMYDIYLQRKNKNKNYSPKNCYVITEKELHECKTLNLVLSHLYVTKKYEEDHDNSVSYMTMYSRYYVYDLNLDDALHCKYDSSTRRTCLETIGFSPMNFYKSVATDQDVPLTTFMSRIHYSYLNGGFTIRPYDMLKEDYSIEEETAKQGKVSYKKQWERDRKEKADKQTPNSYTVQNNNTQSSIYDDYSVYSNTSSINVYGK